MEAVLESAMLLFWERGYESTSLAQLREATGLSSASLYGAFGSKEGLFEKAVEHYVAGPGRVTDVVADEEISPREAVAGLLHGSVSMQTDPSHPRGCLVALTGTVRLPGAEDAGVREVVAARRAVDRARIRACAVRGIAAGSSPRTRMRMPSHRWSTASCSASPPRCATASRPRTCTLRRTPSS